MSIRRHVKDCSNIDLVRNLSDQAIFELFCGLEAEVPAVDIIGKCKRELTIEEVFRHNFLVVDGCQSVFVTSLQLVVRQPFEEQLVWKYALVENLQSVCVEFEFK